MDFSFRNMISNMPVAYGLYDVIRDDSGRPFDCVFLEVNGKFEELTGRRAAECIGRRASEVLPACFGESFDIRTACIDVTFSGDPRQFEQFSNKLGRWYSISAYSAENGSLVTLFSDITAEKADRISAGRHRKLLKTPLDSAPFGILVVSGGGALLEANAMACRLSGYTEKELQRNGLQCLVERESRIQAYIFFKDMRTHGASSCQLQVRTQAGQALWMSLDARVISQDRYIIYCQDVTSYKLMEDDLVKSELLYRTFIDASSDYIYLKDDNLRFLIMNDGLQAEYNLEYSEIIGKKDSEINPGEFSNEAELSDQTILDTNAPRVWEIKIESIDRSYESRKFPVPIGGGKTGVGAYIRDVTEKKKQDETLKHLLEQTQAMFNEHGAVMLLINPESGRIIDANPAAIAFYGYTKEELLSLNIDDIHMLSPEEAQSQRWKPGEKNRKLFSFPHRLKDGSKRIVDVYSCLITYDNEQVLFSIIFDVTEREEAFEEIKYLSFHDHLTGLYNRRYFDSVLKLMNVSRFMPLAIVMADVNGLKLINDSFGHTEGDMLLKKAAEVITSGCRKDDISARIGGDEFVIILPNTDESEARKIVRRIRKLQSQVKIRQLSLSMSFGCSVKHEAESDIDLIVSDAENKMYKNKLHESSSTRSKTVSVIMKTLYSKCSGEYEHARRVAKIAAAVAREMGLPEDQVGQVETTGLLHDIGKIGIDEGLLNKPGVFTKTDREEIKKHSESGWRILSNSDEYAGIADYILHHHENFDGRGYPRGIRGDAIPLISKIIAVSDAYDAMTKDRPYRGALSVEDAILELQNSSGTQFDPVIVSVLVNKVLAGGRYDLS